MELTTCALCGCEENDIHEFEDTPICTNCYESETMSCVHCDRRIWVEDADSDMCPSCYENHTHCHECNILIHCGDALYCDDDIPYCHACYENSNDRAIKSYSYRPEPIFYGSGLFLGVELEVDEGGECSDNAETLLNIANAQGEKLYIKHDGSIDYGFELVTHPMDLKSHQTIMPWRDILSECVEMGYLSHQTSTCGLHIHCDRKAFGNEITVQEEVIARILFFVETHWNEMLRFSRRTENQINRWARRYGLKGTPAETYKDAKDKRYGRYVCVNLENYDTVEIRIFRGTLRYETLMAAFQLVDEICHMAIGMNDADFQGMSWSDFVSKISGDKQELIDYLKIRRLYINEPVESEEDI